MSDQDAYDVVSTRTEFRGHVITVRVDDVRMSDGTVAAREIVAHPGAVGVVALDDDGQIVLVNQYRPAVRARLDELPAGLLDVEGEPPLDAAKRELAEEARLRADDWAVLLDLQTSPGMTDEAIRIYLARGLHALDSDGDPDPDSDGDGGFVAEHEEITLTVAREPLTEAVRRVYSGALTNAAAVAGILAAVHGRATGWADLRPADAPWPSRPSRLSR